MPLSSAPVALRPRAAWGLVLAGVVSACHGREALPEVGADVSREPIAAGEVWRGTTTSPGSSGRPSRVTVREEVQLDREGRLVRADTLVRDDIGSPEVRFLLEPREHRVVVERGGRRTEWSVPGDEAWIIAPVRGPAAEPIPTPLVAWTTWRATRKSEWARLVAPLEQRSFVVPRDQHVVEQTVLVGETWAEVDEHFVRSIRLGGRELERGPGAAHNAFRFGWGGA